MELLGTKVVLADGKEWVVPSLPMTDEGKRIAKMSDDMAKLETEDPEKAMDAYLEFMYLLLRVNYPDLTEEDAGKILRLEHLSKFSRAMLGIEEPKKA